MGEYIPQSPPSISNGTYTVLEKPLGSTRPIRIVTIGAGASGINMIKALRDSLTDYEHVVYEKNSEVGGTWYENRYPGCTCDIPSHNYQFSWKPNPSWSVFYAPAPEIEKYLCKVCEDENLWTDIKRLHIVEYARWNEVVGAWELKVRDLSKGELFDDYCHFLLDATGILK
jgi:cation diffusion facilitator CzcD-associated flavoprotein CzcO